MILAWASPFKYPIIQVIINTVVTVTSCTVNKTGTHTHYDNSRVAFLN